MLLKFVGNPDRQKADWLLWKPAGLAAIDDRRAHTSDFASMAPVLGALCVVDRGAAEPYELLDVSSNP